jgi:hypothetical protein
MTCSALADDQPTNGRIRRNAVDGMALSLSLSLSSSLSVCFRPIMLCQSKSGNCTRRGGNDLGRGWRRTASPDHVPAAPPGPNTYSAGHTCIPAAGGSPAKSQAWSESPARAVPHRQISCRSRYSVAIGHQCRRPAPRDYWRNFSRRRGLQRFWRVQGDQLPWHV